jgi:tetratricopeptide (TPR) repeat protein
MNMRSIRWIAVAAMLAISVHVDAGQVQPAAAPQATSDQESSVQAARKLLQAGKLDEALAAYKKILAANPDSFDANLGAGIVLDLQLKFEEARKHFAKALAAATPDNRQQALTAMAVSYAFQGNAKEAATFYQQIYDTQTQAGNWAGAAATANALGRVYLETGDTTNARRWYETGYEAARRQPASPGAQLDLWEYRWEHAQARIAAREGRFDEARKHVERARALMEKNPQAFEDERPTFFYLTGYVELYAKNYQKAIEELQQANLEDPFVASLLAQAYEGAGQADKAREQWEAVLKSTAHNIQNAFARPLAMKKLKAKG